MHILRANILGNPNIGLYCYSSDSYCFLPEGTPQSIRDEFEKTLKVPTYLITIAGTSLIGAFLSGNKNCLLVPEITFPNELKKLDKHEIPYKIIDSRLTALGNNILCNDNGCIVNPDYDSNAMNEIKNALKVPTKHGEINSLKIVGSLAKTNNKGCLIANNVSSYEKQFIQKTLKIKCTEGTANFGSVFVSSAIVCNNNGFAIGNISGGPEIANADEALGFIGGE